MAKDPYSVLGVTRAATDEEIKKAYRELARKYHPDNYAGNPLADLVEEKMKELNEAYDAIQKERAGGASGSAGGTRYSSYKSSGITSFAEVRRLISEGKYSDAELIINSTAPGDRGAEWNYLKGCILLQRGQFYDAQRHIETACYLDPGNAEYNEAKNRIHTQAGNFGREYRGGGSGEPDCCGICTTLLIADACCDCCGGRGCC